MTGHLLILGFLQPNAQLSTHQIAVHIGLSVGHVRRVLRWMERHGQVSLTPGSDPHTWSLI